MPSGMTARPIGTFSQKIHCQESPWTTAPPTSGPSATPRPETAPQSPSAIPRRSIGTASLRIVSVSGVTIAPPTPCRARAAISQSIDGESAAAADPSVKMPRPARNTRLRPRRSPSAAPSKRSTAKVNVYAFTVHSRPEMDACRSRCIVGSAVVTTRLSSVVMKSAIEVIANVQTM